MERNVGKRMDKGDRLVNLYKMKGNRMYMWVSLEYMNEKSFRMIGFDD